jgi:hypothetical protein
MRKRKNDPDEDFDEEGRSGPDLEDSYVIQDQWRGPGYSVSLSGRSLGVEENWDDALKLIVTHSVKSNYYPDVYYINDHGNTDLLEIRKKGRGYASKIIQSWV